MLKPDMDDALDGGSGGGDKDRLAAPQELVTVQPNESSGQKRKMNAVKKVKTSRNMKSLPNFGFTLEEDGMVVEKPRELQDVDLYLDAFLLYAVVVIGEITNLNITQDDMYIVAWVTRKDEIPSDNLSQKVVTDAAMKFINSIKTPKVVDSQQNPGESVKVVDIPSGFRLERRIDGQPEVTLSFGGSCGEGIKAIQYGFGTLLYLIFKTFSKKMYKLRDFEELIESRIFRNVSERESIGTYSFFGLLLEMVRTAPESAALKDSTKPPRSTRNKANCECQTIRHGIERSVLAIIDSIDARLKAVPVTMKGTTFFDEFSLTEGIDPLVSTTFIYACNVADQLSRLKRISLEPLPGDGSNLPLVLETPHLPLKVLERPNEEVVHMRAYNGSASYGSRMLRLVVDCMNESDTSLREWKSMALSRHNRFLSVLAGDNTFGEELSTISIYNAFKRYVELEKEVFDRYDRLHPGRFYGSLITDFLFRVVAN